MSFLFEKKKKKPASPIEDDDIDHDIDNDDDAEDTSDYPVKKKKSGFIPSDPRDRDPEDEDEESPEDEDGDEEGEGVNPYINQNARDGDDENENEDGDPENPDDGDDPDEDEDTVRGVGDEDEDDENLEDDETEEEDENADLDGSNNDLPQDIPTDQELIDMEGGDDEAQLDGIPNPYVLNNPPIYKNLTNKNATGGWNDDNPAVNRRKYKNKGNSYTGDPVQEAFSALDRSLRATRMRQRGSAMKRTYAAAKQRTAGAAALTRKARRSARETVRSFLSPAARNWKKLSVSDRQMIDLSLNNKTSRQMMRVMTQRILPVVRQMEHGRIGALRSGKSFSRKSNVKYQMDTSIGESAIQEYLTEGEALQLIRDNIEIMAATILEGNFVNQQNLLRLMRHGLIKDVNTIQLYLKALQDPDMAVRQSHLRARLIEILEKLLDMVLNNNTIFRMMDMELQKQMLKKKPGKVSEEMIAETFEEAFFEHLFLEEGTTTLTPLQYARNRAEALIEREESLSLASMITEDYMHRKWSADRKRVVEIDPYTGKKVTKLKRAQTLDVTGRKIRPSFEALWKMFHEK
jgi:hypothetical protein